MGFIRTLSSIQKKKKYVVVVEVNFDTNASLLMKAIVACDWETVINVSRNDPGQAQVWHHRFNEPEIRGGEQTLSWRVLPIHAAVTYKATVEAFVAVQSAYPAAVEFPDDKGRLPIHLAFRFDADDEILSSLAQEYPEGFAIKDDLGQTPLENIPEDSPRNWIEDIFAANHDSRTERLEDDIATLEETIYYIKETVLDYDRLLTKKSDSIETSFDQLNGSIRVTEKYRMISP